MATKLSLSTQQKLLSVVEKAAAQVADGESPNACIEKLATEHSLRSGEIELVCRAYNVARTNKTREDGDSLHEKSASFELADYEQIVDKLFPKTVAPIDVLKKQGHSSLLCDPYAVPRAVTGHIEKAATFTSSLPLSTFAEDPAMVRSRISRQTAKLAHAILGVIAEEPKLCRQKGEALQKLANFFRQTDGPSYPAVCGVAAAVSPDGAEVLQAIGLLDPGISKRAYSKDFVNLDHPVFTAMTKAAELCLDHRKAVLTNQDIIGGIALLTAKFHDDSLMPEMVKKADIASALTFAGLHGAITNAFSGHHEKIQNLDAADTVDSAVKGIGSPAHEARLKRIALEARLQELASSDPVIKGRNLDEIAREFNGLAEFAPEHAARRIPLQMSLRRQLTQEGLEPHSQSQMLDIESGLRNQNTVPETIL